ncbi:hypothetical protein DV515_00002641 [Chloebia gouldiae]|uniref:Uncharacterized protein n=1 Tax=Chloebia gouldiae TaxID=44316 RepID=A0A3L8STY0_CHLGU|nr:hypothetical protein DV515_00002641 [Chloebia gouldiae]
MHSNRRKHVVRSYRLEGKLSPSLSPKAAQKKISTHTTEVKGSGCHTSNQRPPGHKSSWKQPLKGRCSSDDIAFGYRMLRESRVSQEQRVVSGFACNIAMSKPHSLLCTLKNMKVFPLNTWLRIASVFLLPVVPWEQSTQDFLLRLNSLPTKVLFTVTKPKLTPPSSEICPTPLEKAATGDWGGPASTFLPQISSDKTEPNFHYRFLSAFWTDPLFTMRLHVLGNLNMLPGITQDLKQDKNTALVTSAPLYIIYLHDNIQELYLNKLMDRYLAPFIKAVGHFRHAIVHKNITNVSLFNRNNPLLFFPSQTCKRQGFLAAAVSKFGDYDSSHKTGESAPHSLLPLPLNLLLPSVLTCLLLSELQAILVLQLAPVPPSLPPYREQHPDPLPLSNSCYKLKKQNFKIARNVKKRNKTEEKMPNSNAFHLLIKIITVLVHFLLLFHLLLLITSMFIVIFLLVTSGLFIHCNTKTDTNVSGKTLHKHAKLIKHSKLIKLIKHAKLIKLGQLGNSQVLQSTRSNGTNEVFRSALTPQSLESLTTRLTPINEPQIKQKKSKRHKSVLPSPAAQRTQPGPWPEEAVPAPSRTPHPGAGPRTQQVPACLPAHLGAANPETPLLEKDLPIAQGNDDASLLHSQTDY